MSEQAQVNFRRSPAIPSYKAREVFSRQDVVYTNDVSTVYLGKKYKDSYIAVVPKSDYADIIKWFERTTGKKVIYKTKQARKDYIASFKGGFVDNTGFLRSIGIRRNFVSIARRHEDYDGLIKYFGDYPTSKYCSKSIAVKVWHYFMFAVWQKFPKQISEQAYTLSEAVEKEMSVKPWNTMPVPNPPIVDRRKFAMPQAIAERYPGFYKQQSPIKPAFYEDEIHEGIVGAKYGTYAIAVSEGYTPKQAKRIGKACAEIDRNGTDSYGDTNDTESRHFNLNRHDPKLPDTRMVWAKRHLEAAVELAERGDFAKAEHELGCGLHSLQDAFAHGQMPLGTHKILGFIPDITEYNPVATYEAMIATRAYLHAYKERIKAFAPPSVVLPRGRSAKPEYI
jgi:hypothetical protein